MRSSLKVNVTATAFSHSLRQISTTPRHRTTFSLPVDSGLAGAVGSNVNPCPHSLNYTISQSMLLLVAVNSIYQVLIAHLVCASPCARFQQGPNSNRTCFLESKVHELFHRIPTYSVKKTEYQPILQEKEKMNPLCNHA